MQLVIIFLNIYIAIFSDQRMPTYKIAVINVYISVISCTGMTKYVLVFPVPLLQSTLSNHLTKLSKLWICVYEWLNKWVKSNYLGSGGYLNLSKKESDNC